MRALIQNELTEGVTSQLLNTSIKQLIDATHTSFAETMTAFEITAGRISVQERECFPESKEQSLNFGCSFEACDEPREVVANEGFSAPDCASSKTSLSDILWVDY